MAASLALLGGEPVRKRPYPVHTTMINGEEEKQVLAVLREGHLSGFSARPGERFLGGKKVRELEACFCEFFKTHHAVSFNSATSALHGAVAAAGIGHGDEVITSPYTMSATASAILMQNATPVFADIEERTFGLDPQSVEDKVTEKTKAILTVNLFGHPSRLNELKTIALKHRLVLIEDNAQSPAARYKNQYAGTAGDIGIFSMNYHKAIQTGEGGMALTDNPELAKAMQFVRNHGEAVVRDEDAESEAEWLGWNYRMTEIEAAIGISQLGKLERLNQQRQKLAALLTEKLTGFDFLSMPVVEDGCSHVFYIFPMCFSAKRLGISRAMFSKALRAEGISVSEGYVLPLYLQPLYQKKKSGWKGRCPDLVSRIPDSFYKKGICPVAEKLCFKEMLTTDICKYPNTEREIDEFVQAVDKISRHVSALRKMEEHVLQQV